MEHEFKCEYQVSRRAHEFKCEYQVSRRALVVCRTALTQHEILSILHCYPIELLFVNNRVT
jgi:hypothetical protein